MILKRAGPGDKGLVVIYIEDRLAVSTTFQVTAIPISTGFPRQSLIFLIENYLRSIFKEI